MEIRFDPLNPAEAEAVAKFLNRDTDVVRLRLPTMTAEAIRTIAEADRPDTGAELILHPIESAATTIPAPPVSVAPLAPPAPSVAAAEVFATAPAAPPAGEAVTPIVPAPPVPSAPAAAVPPASATPTSPAELDKNGLPWDARIHSGTKARNADGSWRQRRGLNDPALIARVEGELRALAGNALAPAAGPAPAPSATPPAPASVVPAPPATAPAASGYGEVPPPPNVPPAPVTSPPATAPIPSPPSQAVATATPAPSGATITFAQLMQKVTSMVSTGKTTQARVNEHLTAVGVQGIAQLATRLDLAAAVAALLDADQQ